MVDGTETSTSLLEIVSYLADILVVRHTILGIFLVVEVKKPSEKSLHLSGNRGSGSLRLFAWEPSRRSIAPFCCPDCLRSEE